MGRSSRASAGMRMMRGLRCWAVLCLLGGSIAATAGDMPKAAWFPDPPAVKRFTWPGEPCEGCSRLRLREEWKTMAALAGLGEVRFLLAASEANGQARSVAPDMVVLAPSALNLPDCQLNFLVGHELAHIAQRHFDEDAHELLVLSGKPAGWSRSGDKVMGLLDGNFALALRMSGTWQQQEWEADWVGSLLAAQACGCTLEKGALSYFRDDVSHGGGLAASHIGNVGRMTLLMPFADSARRLSSRVY